jgi:hypothetical protein
VSTINGIFFSSFFSFTYYSPILHGVLSHKKNKIWGKTKIGGPSLPPGDLFFRGFISEKKPKSA